MSVAILPCHVNGAVYAEGYTGRLLVCSHGLKLSEEHCFAAPKQRILAGKADSRHQSYSHGLYDSQIDKIAPVGTRSDSKASA